MVESKSEFHIRPMSTKNMIAGQLVMDPFWIIRFYFQRKLVFNVKSKELLLPPPLKLLSSLFCLHSIFFFGALFFFCFLVTEIFNHEKFKREFLNSFFLSKHDY